MYRPGFWSGLDPFFYLSFHHSLHHQIFYRLIIHSFTYIVKFRRIFLFFILSCIYLLIRPIVFMGSNNRIILRVTIETDLSSDKELGRQYSLSFGCNQNSLTFMTVTTTSIILDLHTFHIIIMFSCKYRKLSFYLKYNSFKYR